MQTAKVFVGSLPRCKPDELRRLFSNYGSVVECDVMNRCAFVHLETTEMADAAIAALNGTVFKGQPIVVEAGRPKYGPGNGSRGGPPGSGDNPGRRPSESRLLHTPKMHRHNHPPLQVKVADLTRDLPNPATTSRAASAKKPAVADIPAKAAAQGVPTPPQTNLDP